MKQFIKNRKNQNIAVLVEKAENPQGLVFVMHGLSGTKEETHIFTFAKAFRDNNYTVVRFDATNSFGESDGSYFDSTLSGFYEDLEDVIEWSKEQDFYQEPFALCGHSIGGISILLYAKNHLQRVSFLTPISSLVSGALFIEKLCSPEELEKWKREGVREYMSRRGFIKRLNYKFVEDILNYDILEYASAITAPTLLITGELDDGAPPQHQQLLFDKLPGKKELHIIKNAPHTFKEKEHLDEVYKIMSEWIKKI